MSAYLGTHQDTLGRLYIYMDGLAAYTERLHTIKHVSSFSMYVICAVVDGDCDVAISSMDHTRIGWGYFGGGN